MFLVLNKLQPVPRGLYQREDTLNQLAFRVYSTIEPFTTKTSQDIIPLIQKPIIRNQTNLIKNKSKPISSPTFSNTPTQVKVTNTTSTFDLELSKINLLVKLPSILSQNS